MLLVVLLVEYDGVLALGHLQVLYIALLVAVATAAAQRVGLVATGNVAFRQGVYMHGDKEVGLIPVGNLGTLPQLKELVGLAGVDDPHVGTVLLNDTAKSQCIAQGQRLLLGDFADRTGVPTAVPGIDDQRERLLCTVHRQYKAKQYPKYRQQSSV